LQLLVLKQIAREQHVFVGKKRIGSLQRKTSRRFPSLFPLFHVSNS
jgi:hypothetical protein